MSAAPAVLITDCDMGPAALERSVLEPAGYRVVHAACRTEDDVIAAARQAGATGLLVQYAPITSRVLAALPDVRALVRYGIGMDNVDVDAAAELGVAALNVPDYGRSEVADHAMALVLGLLRGVPAWSAATARGEWPARGELPEPLELAACTLGLLGFGGIARLVALRAAAFGMRVIAHDPFVPDAEIRAAGARPRRPDDLWRQSTVVSLHLPLSPATRGVVDATALGLVRPGTYLVNTARAGLVDRAAMEDALRDGRLAGVGLDVWWDEPAEPDDPLTRHPAVLLTPHVAWLSSGSVRRLRTSVATRLLAALTEGRS